MKTALVLAAALGLSVSVAGACPVKRDTTASTDKMTVASIATASTVSQDAPKEEK